MPPTENNGAPVIPAGTETRGGIAYNPLQAAVQAQSGQGQPAPAVASAPQVQANAPQGITFQELAQKKGFQNVDDLAKAYAELESHNKKVEMTAADVIKMVQDAQTPAAAPVQSVAPAQQPVGNEQALAIVQSIVKNSMQPLEEKLAVQDLFIRNPDAKDYAEGIATVVKDNPGISWENAYKLAKFETAQQQARDAGRQEAYQNIQQKQGFMAGTTIPTAPGAAQPPSRNIIMDRSVPFTEITKMVQEATRNI